MADDKNNNNAGALGGVFAAQAAAPASTLSDQDMKNVTDTARAEIANRSDAERQMHRHEELWKRERNKIATASDPYPDFDLGSRGHRRIRQEYDERRALWEERRDVIEDEFIIRRGDIRDNGQTLSDEFTLRRSENAGPENEFPVHAAERTRSI